MPQCSVVLLISTYDLGRQPFGLASAAAALRAAGIDVVCADLAKERLSEESVRRAAAIGFFLPMHTATRLALPVIDRVRALNPDARLVAYGLYAPLNAPMLRERGVVGDHRWRVRGRARRGRRIRRIGRINVRFGRRRSNSALGTPASASGVPRVHFLVPDRAGLPALTKYATLQWGEERTHGRLYRGQPGLQAPVPPLSDRARLRRPLPRRPRRYRHG